jgi:predicted transcriptional regulator
MRYFQVVVIDVATKEQLDALAKQMGRPMRAVASDLLKEAVARSRASATVPLEGGAGA